VGFQTFVEWMRACYTCSPDDIVSRADAFAKMGREAQKQLLSVGLNTLEAILTSQYLGADELRLPVDQQKPIRSLAKLLNLHQIQLTVNLLQEASESIQQNANAKILYTHFSREIHEVFHNPQ
jgi:DNA polymerase-3 subunit delta'